MIINGNGKVNASVLEFNTKKAEIGIDGTDFAKQVEKATITGSQNQIVLRGSDEEAGDIAVLSLAEIVSSSSVTVYKPQNFDIDNPVYKVKIWDNEGNTTEHLVDVSKIDPRDCNAIEMYVFTADLKDKGKGSFEDTVLKAVVAKNFKNDEDSSGSCSFTKKTDWVKTVNDIMKSVYNYGDLKGYMEWKKFLDILTQ